MSRLLFVFAVLIALPCAGCSEPHFVHDGGSEMQSPPDKDAGTSGDAGHDAATAPGMDSGMPTKPVRDGGHPDMDANLGDAGHESDAGRDAGMPEHDAGMPEHDAGTPEHDAGMPEHDAGCVCSGGNLCVPDAGALGAGCIDFCSIPAMLPGALAKDRPQMWSCAIDYKPATPTIGFDQLCKNRCLYVCERQNEFCAGHPQCAPDYCDSDEVKAACASECNTGTAQAKHFCIRDKCGDTIDWGCNDTVCPGETKTDCPADTLCTNNCIYPGNGFCNDGDVFGSEPTPDADNDQTDNDFCAWGTDCNDCGPRHGFAPIHLPLGSQCQYDSNCAGYARDDDTWQPDLAHNAAWCRELSDVLAGDKRCVPDASGDGETCPKGFTLTVLTTPDSDHDGKPEPIVIGGRTARACIPVCK